MQNYKLTIAVVVLILVGVFFASGWKVDFVRPQPKPEPQPQVIYCCCQSGCPCCKPPKPSAPHPGSAPIGQAR